MKLQNLAFCVVAFFAFSSPVFAEDQNTSRLSWRVTENFRFFGDTMPKNILDDLRLNTISQSYENYTSAITGENSGPILKFIYENVYCKEKSCDNLNKERKYPHYKEEYIQPKFYKILASLIGSAASDSNCHWYVNDVHVLYGTCTAAELKLPSINGNGAISKIQVFQGATEAIKETVVINDRLIIGMGDSFAAGEGNPDRPANFTPIPPPEVTQRGDKWYSGIIKHAKTNRRNVGWLDSNCHRSMLSYQVMAAVSYAARHPQEAVTFVSLSCSGAAVFGGLLTPQAELPGAVDASGKQDRLLEYPSQFEQLNDVLCPAASIRDKYIDIEPQGWRARKISEKWKNTSAAMNSSPIKLATCSQPRRKVDYVFLSIGGNDIGFAGVVASVVIPPRTYRKQLFRHLNGLVVDYINDIGGTVCADVEDTDPRCLKEGADTANGNIKNDLDVLYQILQKTFETYDIDPKHIWQTAYPDPSFYEGPPEVFNDYATPLKGTVCPLYRIREYYDSMSETIGMGKGSFLGKRVNEYSPGFEVFAAGAPEGLRDVQLWIQPSEIDLVEQKVILPLNEKIKQNNMRWNTVDSFISDSKRHGWCEVARTNSQANHPTAARAERNALRFPVEMTNKAYQRRKRWFRTANDSILMQLDINGTMHPSAEMHASMADALMIELGSPPAR